MAAVLLKFSRIIKNGAFFYIFEGFENVKPRGELPCEYLSGLHFAVWNEALLYSDGKNLFSLTPGSEVSEDGYRKFMQLVERCKERLREINSRNQC
jgi:hypothetical protein